MNYLRRREHDLVFRGLGLLAPALFVSALALRPDFGPGSALAPALNTAAGLATPTGPQRSLRIVSGQSVPLELEVFEPTASGVALRLRPERALGRPDLVVYWTKPGATDVGQDATLVGTVRGAAPRTLDLPPRAVGEAGELVLYSVAHAEIVDRIQLLAAWTSTGARHGRTP